MDNDGFEATNKSGGSSTAEIEEIIDEVEKRYRRCKHFCRLSEAPADHHFKHSRGCDPRSSLWEKMREEWRMFATSPPDWAYVHTYFDRIDLMRAVLIGPPGTPYYQALFFFDIYFPNSYGRPSVFYRSYGVDFSAKAQTKLSSTVLDAICGGVHNIRHLLFSIRDLLYNGEARGRRRSLMVECEKMMNTLAKPPLQFEDFVAGHFRNRAHDILVNLKVYMARCSEDMTELFVKVLNVFEKNGTYCQHHLDNVQLKSVYKAMKSREEEEEDGQLSLAPMTWLYRNYCRI